MKYTLLFIAFLALLLCGCQRSGKADYIPKETTSPTVTSELQTPVDETFHVPVDEDAQLLCQVQSQEEADAVAELYGIELVSYYHGLATYRTEENPREVILRGETQGWPELSLNQIMKPY